MTGLEAIDMRLAATLPVLPDWRTPARVLFEAARAVGRSEPGARQHQLSTLDSVFVYAEGRETPMHLTTMYIFDQSTVPGGVFRHKDMLRLISGRLSTSPVFQQRLVRVPLDLDRPYWLREENVDLEFHVRHLALPEPRDWRQLCVVAARLHARPLDMKRPPWEINIIEGLDRVEGLPPGCFAALVKYHHAAVDGATGNDILSGLTDTFPEPEPLPELRPYDRRAIGTGPGSAELLARAAVNGVTRPWNFVRDLVGVAPGLTRLVTRTVRPDRTGIGLAPSTRFQTRVSPHRVVQGAEFDLQDFKKIKAAVPGATINDVVLALCGGMLRAYLLAKDDLPEASLVASVPINTRVPGEPPPRGNSVAVMYAAMHTEIADPIERLRAVAESTTQAKDLTEAIGARQYAELASQLPAPAAALVGRLATRTALGARLPALGNVLVTNVPSSPVPLYLNGARLVAIYGYGPVVDGVGLLIFITSYNGKLSISLTSCRDIVDDPQFLVSCLTESFTALRDGAHQVSAD